MRDYTDRMSQQIREEITHRIEQMHSVGVSNMNAYDDRIRALETTGSRTSQEALRDTGILFERVRQLELNSASQAAVKEAFTRARASFWVALGSLSGAISVIAYVIVSRK